MSQKHGGGLSFLRLRKDSKKPIGRSLEARQSFWLDGQLNGLELTLSFVTSQTPDEGANDILATPLLTTGGAAHFTEEVSRLSATLRSRQRVALVSSAEKDFLVSGFEHVKFYDQLFEGKYSPANFQDDLLPLLARRMASREGVKKGPGIPAAYTYFGQFLAHDMSYMNWEPDLLGPGVGGWANARHAHALDFGTLFGTEPTDKERTSDWREEADSALGLLAWCPSALDDAFDLPRADPSVGAHCCRDPRVDGNLALAQMHVLLVRFHQEMARRSGETAAQSQTTTRQHLQAVVLTDFLPRIIPEDTYCDIMESGCRLVVAEQNNFLVPIEFALACFRFGHSMVQEKYHTWAINYPELDAPIAPRIARLSALFGYTRAGQQLKQGRLQFNWNQPWLHMVDETEETLPVATAMARPISASIQPDLAEVGAEHFDRIAGTGNQSLGLITLQRGVRFGLPSGQDLAAQAGLGKHFDVTDFLKTHSDQFEGLVGNEQLCEQAPLWFYTLAEAEALGCGKLGPLGGRVVMETIVSALLEAEDSILIRKPCGGFRNQFSRGDGKAAKNFKLSEVVSIANGNIKL